jgi:hypothetical protein
MGAPFDGTEKRPAILLFVAPLAPGKATHPE